MPKEHCVSDGSNARKFRFIGGVPCFDFCNTVGGKRGSIQREHLNSYLDLLNWSRQAGLLDDTKASALAEKAATHPAAARTVLTRATGLREAIYRIFLAVLENQPIENEDLAQLNGELSRTLNRLQVALAERPAGFRWQWMSRENALDEPLGPVARSAADLLTADGALGRVRRCEGDHCGWLFLDSSKNHSRRWCDMRDCGNRAKVRRHRLKQRRQKPSE